MLTTHLQLEPMLRMNGVIFSLHALLAWTGTAVPFWRRCACGLIDCLAPGIVTDPVDTAVQRTDRCHLRTKLKVIKLKYRINPVYPVCITCSTVCIVRVRLRLI